VNGKIRLASVKCPAGLAFDVTGQTCDWKANVKNCDLVESKSYLQDNFFFLAKEVVVWWAFRFSKLEL
jgi:hypothetical protein